MGKKTNNKSLGLLLLLFTIFIVIIYFFIYFLFWNSYHSTSPTPKIVNIPHNSTLKEISEILKENDVIYNKTFFKVSCQILGWSDKLYAGRYSFQNDLSNYDVLKILTQTEQQIAFKVTIREGLTAKQIAGLFNKKINIDSAKFLKLVHNKEFISHKCSLNVKTLEGFLFPKTYSFYWEPSEEEVILALVKEFKRFFVDSLHRRMKEKNQTLEQVITLASIVEGEAKLDEERSTIAGVYTNRLRKNMNLEADPTIQYVLPGGPRRLFNRDYKFESSYNTYLHPGLPPGPINNPGEKSIMAALYPEKNNYLYFVARGDGGHYFSENYGKHVRSKQLRKRTPH